MRGVVNERLTIQPWSKHLLACGDGFIRIHLVKAGILPRTLVALDNECRKVTIKPIRMHLEYTELIVDHYERESAKLQWRTQPDVTGTAHVEIRPEMLLITTSHPAVYTVRANYQVMFGSKACYTIVIDFLLELETDA